MSVEVIADCDGCGDKFDRDARDKVFCETCHDKELRELSAEIWDLQGELRAAKAMIAHLESELKDAKDELMEQSQF